METEPQTDEGWSSISLEVVRRRDLGEAARWQENWAVVADLALYLTVAFLVASRLDFPFLLTAVAAYSVMSFVHRVPLQWWWGTTTGRALFGLRCVAEATRRKGNARHAAQGLVADGVLVRDRRRASRGRRDSELAGEPVLSRTEPRSAVLETGASTNRLRPSVRLPGVPGCGGRRRPRHARRGRGKLVPYAVMADVTAVTALRNQRGAARPDEHARGVTAPWRDRPALSFHCSRTSDRTWDARISSPPLCQLRSPGRLASGLGLGLGRVPRRETEPRTRRLSVGCSTH